MIQLGKIGRVINYYLFTYSFVDVFRTSSNTKQSRLPSEHEKRTEQI